MTSPSPASPTPRSNGNSSGGGGGGGGGGGSGAKVGLFAALKRTFSRSRLDLSPEEQLENALFNTLRFISRNPNSLKEEGVFRASAIRSEVMRVKKIIIKKAQNNITSKNTDIHTVIGALKACFLEYDDQQLLSPLSVAKNLGSSFHSNSQSSDMTSSSGVGVGGVSGSHSVSSPDLTSSSSSSSSSNRVETISATSSPPPPPPVVQYSPSDHHHRRYTSDKQSLNVDALIDPDESMKSAVRQNRNFTLPQLPGSPLMSSPLRSSIEISTSSLGGPSNISFTTVTPTPPPIITTTTTTSTTSPPSPNPTPQARSTSTTTTTANSSSSSRSDSLLPPPRIIDERWKSWFDSVLSPAQRLLFQYSILLLTLVHTERALNRMDIKALSAAAPCLSGAIQRQKISELVTGLPEMRFVSADRIEMPLADSVVPNAEPQQQQQQPQQQPQQPKHMARLSLEQWATLVENTLGFRLLNPRWDLAGMRSGKLVFVRSTNM